MTGFEVLRRVYVDFEGINLRRKFLTGLEPESINVMIGTCTNWILILKKEAAGSYPTSPDVNGNVLVA